MKKSMNWLVLSLVLIISFLSGSPFAAAQEQKSLEVLQHEYRDAEMKILELETWTKCQTDIRWVVHGLKTKETWLRHQIRLQQDMMRVQGANGNVSRSGTAQVTTATSSQSSPVQNTTVNVEAPSPDTATKTQETPSGEFPWGYVGGAVLLLLLLMLLVFLVRKYRPALMEWWQERQQRKAAEATEASRLQAIGTVKKIYEDSRQLALQAEVITKKAEKDATQLRSDADATPGDAAKEAAAKKAEEIYDKVDRLDRQLSLKLSDIEDAKLACDVATIDVKQAAQALEKADKALESASKLFVELERTANPPTP